MCGIVLLFLRNDENFFDLLLFRVVCGCCRFYFGFAVIVVGICARDWAGAFAVSVSYSGTSVRLFAYYSSSDR